MNPKSSWTPERDQILIREYPVTDTYELARRLGVSYHVVKARARKFKVRKDYDFMVEMCHERALRAAVTLRNRRKTLPTRNVGVVRLTAVDAQPNSG